MKSLKWRGFVIFATILLSVYLLIPSYIKFVTGKTIPKTPKDTDPWYYHYLPSETLKLGLDLMGGLHLKLGIDFHEVHRDAITKLKNQLLEFCEQEKITGVTAEATNDNKIVVKFPDDATWKKVEEQIGKHLNDAIDYESQTGNSATLKMTILYENSVNTRAIDQSIETLRNRIDEFGIAEPIITRQGEDKIMVEFPGVQEPGRLKEIIARTAKLSFQTELSGPEEPGGTPSPAKMDELVKQYVSEQKLVLDTVNPITKHVREFNAWLQGKIPDGTEILFQKKVNINTKEATYTPYLLKREAIVGGDDLQDAYYAFDPQNNTPEVNFQLTPSGAQKFEKGTGENVGKYMAIVLDNNVHSAPRIKQKIGGGRARIEMGSTGRAQNEILNDAKDTALVLRSGALPARLEFLEERVVGPSLGADAIRSGMTSLGAGLLLVFLFMGIYYRTSGTFANIALVLNGVLLLAAMAAFEGTLTLPGLAGITLTLGMAVDANVLILEHMREEFLTGKSLAHAVGEGYSRAFSAIIDSHVTTIIAGLVLLNFGYGPIRGFAVTLLIGLAASLYTSVFVTRVIFDFVINKGKQHISI